MQKALLLKLIDDTLEFTYHFGDVTPIQFPHTTGWRTLPYLMTAQAPGRGSLEVGGKGKFIVDEPMAASCVAPGVYHRCALLSRRSVSRWSCTSFTILGGVDVFSLIDAPYILKGAAAKAIRDINTRLAGISKSPESTLQSVAQRKSLGFQLFATIAGASRWRPDHDAALLDSQRLLPVFTHIHDHLHKPIRLEDLARIAHLSSSRFHAVFKRSTGTSPHRYLQRRRMQKAQQCLISTDLSVGEIAEKVGLPDPYFFSRQFKKECGASPRSYRAKIREGIA